jgi:lipoate-protein ligase B
MQKGLLSSSFRQMKNTDRKWFCIELPTTQYREAWDLQVRLVNERKDGTIDGDIILMLEHFPVFTLGRRGGLKNLNVSEDSLEESGISVIHTERGGDITFHAPGQLVIYPIIDLRAAGMGVTDYVGNLEEIMIRTAAHWGIAAVRNPLSRGVWIDNHKLGSIGIAIRRGICFHGMALNVGLSLEPFGWINPCGLEHIKATSMEQVLSCEISMGQVRQAVKSQIQEVFGVELITTELGELKNEG